MSELIQGPVPNWQPTESWSNQTERFLSSEDELYNAYGTVMQAGCFVKEFAGLAAVGEAHNLEVAEFRTGKEIDISELGMFDCMALGAWPGRGETRTQAVLDGLRQVLEARKIDDDKDALELFGSFAESGYKVEALMPLNSSQPRQWTVRIYKDGEEEVLREEVIPMIYEPVFGVDMEDQATLETRVDELMREIAN